MPNRDDDVDIELVCAVVKVIVTDHQHGGDPIPREALVRLANHGADKDKIREAVDEALKLSFIEQVGNDLIRRIDTPPESLKCGQFLYDNCCWSKLQIEGYVSRFPGKEHLENRNDCK